VELIPHHSHRGDSITETEDIPFGAELDFVQFGEKKAAGTPLEGREKQIKVLSDLGGYSCRFPIPF
jgi:hypothetical protein